MTNIFPIDFEEKLTMAQDDYILFSDSEDGNKIKKAQYKNLKGEPGTPGTPGADGQDGEAATITVGTTTTGAAGSSASVTNSGTSSAAVFNFTIPQGAKGEPGEDGQDGADGAAATITVGTTTTLSPGSSATVTNVGTSSAAILNFGIPKGDSGEGSGDVVGPASSTDGHIAVFDGATGKIIKDGGPIPTGDVGVSTDTGTLLSAGVNLWLGTESDFSSISTPDTNTLYIQYKSDGGGGGWTPGADTIAYYPFDTDWDDYSGNGYNITTTGASSIGTNQGVDCLSINNSTLQASTIDSMASYSEYTWLFYAYRVSDWYEIQFADGGAWGGNGPSFRVSSNEMRWGNGTDTYTSFSNSYSPMNTWFFFALVVRSGNGIIYCNNNSTTIKTGVLAPSANAAPLRIGAINGGNCYGYLSKLILEKRAWTDQEIIDYFNATKGDYGIS